MNTCKLNDIIFINFVQGSVWKNKIKNHESQIVFPLFLFFDDFKIENPLGSHFGVHKLGAVYIYQLYMYQFLSYLLINSPL
jgi:hypothetical protein